jgi:intracellular sulfur oxidation DsrE/DsrF family protein
MRHALLAALALSALPVTHAGEDAFTAGPAITAYGKVAPIPDATPLAPETALNVAFDLAKPAKNGAINRGLDSAARFINMHRAAGLPADNISVAIVVHGGAYADLMATEGNANAPLIAALLENGSTIMLCGQTAAYRDVDTSNLLPGVTLSLSAMTAHALLQQDGYTLNPF